MASQDISIEVGDKSKLGAPAATPRVFEIGPRSFFKDILPTRVTHLDTRFEWADIRCSERLNESVAGKIRRMATGFLAGVGHAWRQDYDVVVTRNLGAVNCDATRVMAYFGRLAMASLLVALVRFASRGRRVSLAVVDVLDGITVHPRDRGLIRHCDLYFKRELATNTWQTLAPVLPRGLPLDAASQSACGLALAKKMRPFSLGIAGSEISKPLAAANKHYDIFYCGRNAGKIGREAAVAALDLLQRRGWRVYSPSDRLSRGEFRHAIRSSRLCLSPGGFGWDCYRHYEVVALGSIPIMDYRPIEVICPFIDKRECFYYDPQADIASTLDGLLSTPDSILDEMVVAAQEKLRAHYTNGALVRYALSELSQIRRGV